jgi:nucleotide-binding universal stress UspA family protein
MTRRELMNILVAVDFADTTEAIVRRAEEIAVAFSAKVWLIHVAEPEPDFIGYQPGPQTERDFLAERLRTEHRGIQQIAERLRTKGLDVTALLVQGATVETILEEADRLKIDMIIVGSHGRGAMYHLLLGSVSEGVLRGAACPTLVVPTRRHA